MQITHPHTRILFTPSPPSIPTSTNLTPRFVRWTQSPNHFLITLLPLMTFVQWTKAPYHLLTTVLPMPTFVRWTKALHSKDVLLQRQSQNQINHVTCRSNLKSQDQIKHVQADFSFWGSFFLKSGSFFNF